MKIVITACGLSPVGINTVLSLKEKAERIVGVDISNDNIGTYLYDSFYKVPLAVDNNYIPTILNICQIEKIDTIIPLTIEETITLIEHKNVFNARGIIIANGNELEEIHICNDKWKTYEFLKKRKVDIPYAYSPRNIDQLISCVKALGYPDKKVAFKPRTTHGSRGFRILSANFDKYDILLSQKPQENIYLTLEDLTDILGTSTFFPDIVVMDYLEGDDYSVYCLCYRGESLITLPMKRSGLIPGMSTGGILIKESKVITYINKILKEFGFTGAINIQLKNTKKGPLLYEINSRISATTVMTSATGINFPYLNCLLCRNDLQTVKSEIASKTIKWGIELYRIHREIYKYKDECFELKNGYVESNK
jgi:carbamoyl-phosphate synthase large subunit